MLFIKSHLPYFCETTRRKPDPLQGGEGGGYWHRGWQCSLSLSPLCWAAGPGHLCVCGGGGVLAKGMAAKDIRKLYLEGREKNKYLAKAKKKFL